MDYYKSFIMASKNVVKSAKVSRIKEVNNVDTYKPTRKLKRNIKIKNLTGYHLTILDMLDGSVSGF